MTKDDLLAYIRVQIDDTFEPYLVADEKIEQFIDEAEKEAFERAYIARTDRSYDVNISAGKSEYKLNELIFYIERVKIDGEDFPLTKTTKRELDFEINNWESETGTPKLYFQENKRITLYPTPEESGRLLIDAFRYPRSEMETPQERHEDLAYWCMYRIYQIKDSDLNSLQDSELNRAMFSEAFGHKRSFQHDMNMRNLSNQSSMYKHPFI